jgi:HK97 family phage major capsid protein
MSGPSVEYLVHTGNTNPAAAVAELGTKPDLGMQLSAKIAYPVKIAALASFSMEALHDFGTFLTFVPAEMQRAVIDAESDQIINGNGTAPNMTGILATSNVLTRAYPTSPATNETGLDTLELAVNDIRVGPAFAKVDLFVMSPGTYSALRRLKDILGRFLLEDDIKQAGAATIWGVPVVQTTKIANGTVIVADSSALMGWTRMGLTVETNGYGDTEWTTNAVSFRCEERIALGVLRPKAVNIVTGIPADTTATT